MIVPGDPADPIQLIDVRDVADWIVRCLEQSILGIYNVTGPAKPLSMKGMVEGVRTGTASHVDFVWIDNHFLDSHGAQDGQFPLYAPPKGDTAGFHRCNCSRALARGLLFRPLPETARAILELVPFPSGRHSVRRRPAICKTSRPGALARHRETPPPILAPARQRLESVPSKNRNYSGSKRPAARASKTVGRDSVEP